MSDLSTFRNHARKEASSGRPMPDGERALWAQLAAEVDAYLARDPDVVDVPVEETGPSLFDQEASA